MKFSDAEPVLVDNLKRHRRILGDGRYETVDSFFTLARFYDSRGRLDDAAKTFFECHEALSAVSRLANSVETSLLILGAKSNLADVLAKQGRHLDALTMHIDCFERRSKILMLFCFLLYYMM
jgi:hypothetical protein